MKGYVDPARISPVPIKGYVAVEYLDAEVLDLAQALRAIADGKTVERLTGDGDGPGAVYSLKIPRVPAVHGTFMVVK